MTISRTDWWRAQLQAQLRRRTQTDASRPGPSGEATAPSAGTPSTRLRALQAQGVTDETVLVMALLQDLLVPTFGQAMEGDPRFQQALAEVLEQLRADPELWALCQRALAKG